MPSGPLMRVAAPMIRRVGATFPVDPAANTSIAPALKSATYRFPTLSFATAAGPLKVVAAPVIWAAGATLPVAVTGKISTLAPSATYSCSSGAGVGVGVGVGVGAKMPVKNGGGLAWPPLHADSPVANAAMLIPRSSFMDLPLCCTQARQRTNLHRPSLPPFAEVRSGTALPGGKHRAGFLDPAFPCLRLCAASIQLIKSRRAVGVRSLHRAFAA